MIQSKKDLLFYLAEDAKMLKSKPKLKDKILKNENWYCYQLIRCLRYVEYYKNTRKSKMDIIKTLLYSWSMFKYKRLCWRTHAYIAPNSCGPGLVFYHLGSTIYIRKTTKIGKNFKFVGGLLVGKKAFDNKEHVEIGDNCYIGYGVTILGNIRIGDNVTIGAGSLITKDIPNNVIVAGIPAKIIRFK